MGCPGTREPRPPHWGSAGRSETGRARTHPLRMSQLTTHCAVRASGPGPPGPSLQGRNEWERSRNRAGPTCQAPRAAQRRRRRPSTSAPPDASVAPRARYSQRPGAQPAWPRCAAALPIPSPAGTALPPHRELFLLLGSTPLKVVVVVMAPRSEVGWRGRRALKKSGPRGAEEVPTLPPATAAEASATAFLAGRRFYRALKSRPHPTSIGRFK